MKNNLFTEQPTVFWFLLLLELVSLGDSVLKSCLTHALNVVCLFPLFIDTSRMFNSVYRWCCHTSDCIGNTGVFTVVI